MPQLIFEFRRGNPVRLCGSKFCLAGVTTVGKTPKTVLRIAIERASIDVLQWLLGGDDAAPHIGVPMQMPHDTGSSAAALHRALEAALREGWRQRSLISLTLDQAAASSQQPAFSPLYSQSAERAAKDGSGSGRDSECVVCLAAPADHVLVPCGHNCVCEDCCGIISSCPICRAAVERTLRVFTN
mmetsp:Transcript_32975/g.77058  ORF Transcript_32975/g.77058 Transcript_32975/m.77058 type:complete len:185 (-) Transcript_32975:1246-1800(-)